MKTGIKRLVVTALVLCLCIESGGALALGDSTSAATTSSTKNDSGHNIQTISSGSDGSELADMIRSHWNDSYFEDVVIDPEHKTVSKDGEKTTVQDALDLNKKDAAAVMKSAHSAEKYFSDSVYESDVEKDGDVVVTAPFQTMRIVVSTNSLTDTYGAAEALDYPEYNKYILQYDTQEATQEAYTKLIAKYGSDCCGLDKVFTQNELFQDTNTTSTASSYSWGATLMGMDYLKAEENAESDGDTATVAVLDSGIDAQNQLFDGRTILSTSLSFIDGDFNLNGGCGHGTHVAGIIADCTPDNINFLILRVLDDNNCGTTLSLFAALEYAVKEKADVINMSLEWSYNNASQAIKDLIDLAINDAYQAGIPIFAAAGNDLQDVSTAYPACNSQTIAVSALNQNGTFAFFSNYGSGIDFAAPGVNVISAWKDGGFACLSGTSMAAPHMSAAAAYIKLHNPDITVSDLYQVLKRYAVDAGPSGKDALYGWGYVNLYSYYNELGKASVSTLINTPNGISVNWEKVAGASGYYLYRKVGSSSSWNNVKTISSGGTVSWTDTNVSYGTNYSYMVRAYGNGSVGLHQSTQTACRLNNANPVFNWSADGKNCTVTYTCANDPSQTVTYDCTVTSKVKTAPTCTVKGTTTYTATYGTDTDTKDVQDIDIDSTNHAYANPVFNWSADEKSCTVTYTCANNSSHTVTYDCTVTSKVKTAPTCTVKGTTTYTAKYGTDTYTKDVRDIDLVAHTEKSKVTAATTSTDGKIVKYCSVCNKTLSTTTIKKIKSATLKYSSATYTGKALKPAVTVKDSAGKTINSSNYAVSYKGNKNVGTATVTIKFKGNYSGTLTKKFKINPKSRR